LLDALSFVLFGKPHRNINKPQLLNSVNEKDCLVEIYFTIGTIEYSIRRGIKPNIFEIYKDGEMINQQSHSRDYQKVLESNILKMNHRSFHQIVVLGSSSFIPFMQLQSYHRRMLIEDLLDISIFSKMNLVLREKKNALKDALAFAEEDIRRFAAQIELQKKHIEELDAVTANARVRIETEIADIDADINDLTKKINESLKTVKGLNDIDIQEASAQLDMSRTYETGIQNKLRRLSTQQSFFIDHDECPSCSQTIAEDTKQTMIAALTKRLDELKVGFAALRKQTAIFEATYQSALDIQSQRNQIHSEIAYNQRLITSKNKDKLAKCDAICAVHDSGQVAQSKDYLVELLKLSQTKIDERMTLLEQGSYHGICEELLKDTGIKTKIIRQYLPVMNKLINEYLQIFDFFVSFTIDENFNEKIKSHHRDDFSYASFSEGEKARIDLALMFTWRRIAKLKNSTDSNLLILDEIMDASLDEPGLNALKTVFDTLEKDSNIFVISHRGEVKESSDFDRMIKVYKKDLFTQIAVEV